MSIIQYVQGPGEVTGASAYNAPTSVAKEVGVILSDNEHSRSALCGDLASGTQYEFSVKRPKVSANAPGGYTQMRLTVFAKTPKTLANGNLTYNTRKLEISVDPETTPAEIEVYLFDLLQICGYGADSSLSNNLHDFFTKGALQ